MRRRNSNSNSGWESLTPREVDVVSLVTQGLRNREMAERMKVSHHTVESHLKHIFAKLGIRSRVELATMARDHLPR